MGSKIGLIFNIAPIYRRAIYSLIDNTWDCRWLFGDNRLRISEFDKKILHDATLLPVVNKKIWYYQGISKWLGANKDLSHIIAIGDPHCLSVWIILLKRLFKRKNFKVILWTHGWYGRESFFERLLKRFFFTLADSTLLYGNYAKNLMIQEGVPSEKLYVIHNSLDYETQLKIRKSLIASTVYQDHFQNDNKNIVFIGRLESSKRIDLALQAIYILKSRGELFNLTLIGDGVEQKGLNKKAADLGIDSQIWFYGSSYEEEINGELLFNADICVSPGNIGLTAIHSLMFGTPCITHDNFAYQGPEFESIKKGVTGAFFKHNDAQSLADVISRWFKSNLNRQQIREWCYEEIDSNWTPNYQIDTIKKVLG